MKKMNILGLLCIAGALGIFGFRVFAPENDAVITGRVLEKSTSIPIANAYVMAMYARPGPTGGHGEYICVKTRGMSTGADGAFSFPGQRGLRANLW